MGCSFSKRFSAHDEFGEYHRNLQERVSFYRNANNGTQLLGYHLSKQKNSLRLPRPCTWTSDQPITMSNLIRRRKEFWETAPSYGGSPEIWNTLRLVIETMPVNLATAQTIINTSKIILPTGDLIDGCYDERGSYYYIPPYIFSEPTNLISESPEKSTDDKINASIKNEKESELNKSCDSETVTDEHTSEIIIRLSNISKDISIKIDSKKSIAHMKQYVAEIADIKKPMHFFLLGKMLSDEKSLVDQGWKEGRVVQALILN